MTPDQVNLLERLNRLKKEGVLSEAEYMQARQRILDTVSENSASEEPVDPPHKSTAKPVLSRTFQITRFAVVSVGVIAGLAFAAWFLIFGSEESPDEHSVNLSKMESVQVAAVKQQVSVRKAPKSEEEKEEAEATFKRLKPLMRYEEEGEGGFYHVKGSPVTTNQSGLDVYFSYNDKVAGDLRWRIQYTGKEELFIHRMEFLIDDKSYYFIPYRMETVENKKGKINEWFDQPLDANAREILNALVVAETAKVRFIGRRYHDEQVIKTTQRKAIKQVLEAHSALTSI